MAATPFPWQVTVDPTDLLALPALLLAWRVLVPAMERRPALRPLLERGAVLASGLACLATSPPNDPVYGTWAVDLVVGNATDETVVLRLRPLAETVRLDCAAVAAAPETMLRPRHFSKTPVTWEVDPGRTVPVRGTGGASVLEEAECYAYLLEGGGLPPTLLFWQAAAYPVADIASQVATADATRLVRIEAIDGAVRTADHPAAHAPAFVTPESSAVATCAVPGASAGLEWSTPAPTGRFTLTASTRGVDGCFLFELTDDRARTERLYLCVPLPELPFAAGEFLTILRPNTRAEPYEGLELTNGTTRVRLARAVDTVTHGTGDGTIAPLEGCTPSYDRCGDVLVPLGIDLADADGTPLASLSSGQSAPVGGGTLHVLRAFDFAVVDTACEPVSEDFQRVVESIWIGPEEGAEEAE